MCAKSLSYGSIHYDTCPEHSRSLSILSGAGAHRGDGGGHGAEVRLAAAPRLPRGRPGCRDADLEGAGVREPRPQGRHRPREGRLPPDRHGPAARVEGDALGPHRGHGGCCYYYYCNHCYYYYYYYCYCYYYYYYYYYYYHNNNNTK